MRVNMNYASSTVSLPITVTYNCEHCDYHNVDNYQTLRATRTSRGSIAGVSEGMKKAASERSEEAFNSMLEDIKNKRYRKANLTCRCQKCRKAQSWSSFIIKPMVVSIPMFIIGVVFLIALFMNMDKMQGGGEAAMIIVTSVLMLPLVIIYAINLIKENKASKISEKYLPVITLRQKEEHKGLLDIVK